MFWKKEKSFWKRENVLRWMIQSIVGLLFASIPLIIAESRENERKNKKGRERENKREREWKRRETNLEEFLLINFPTTGQKGFIIIINIRERRRERETNRKKEKDRERRREKRKSSHEVLEPKLTLVSELVKRRKRFTFHIFLSLLLFFFVALFFFLFLSPSLSPH